MPDNLPTDLVARLERLALQEMNDVSRDIEGVIPHALWDAKKEIERLQLLAADYGGQLVAERAETRRLRIAIGHYVRTKKANLGENAHYWWTLQEIAKESSADVGGGG